MNSTTYPSFLAPYFSFSDGQSPGLLSSNHHLFLPNFATTILLLTLGFVAYQRVSRRTLGSAAVPLIKSSLPWVGSALDFVRAPANFLQECREQYGSVYKIRAAGRTILVTSSPKSILTMLHRKSMDFEIVDFLNLHTISGLDRARMPKIWPAVLEVFSVSHPLLTPNRIGPLMNTYNSTIVQHFRRLTASEDPTTYTLDEFVFRTNHFAVYGMFMGTDFHSKAKTYNHWRAYDNGVHNIIRRLPFFSRSAIQGREQLLETVSAHIQEHWTDSSEGGDLNGASELMSVVARKLKQSAATEEETARIINYLLWGTAGNIARLTNWVMRYIVVYPDLQQEIRQEIQQVVDAKYTQFDQLLQIDPRSLGSDFPLLCSTVNEVIRLLTQAVILRQATVDTFLTGENGLDIPISKGDYILADTQGYHHADEHFEDAQRFKPDRFTQSQAPNRSLAFSAGPHICSGAFLAQSNVRMFVILCFQLYDVEVKFEKGVASALEVLPNSFLQLPLPKFQADITLRQRDA